MKLFISYASEDKDFVEPLAAALKAAGFEIWFDKYVLTLGDSLLKKINEGLVSADYGVVVLSSNFFKKKWPQAELDGLFSLQTATKKVILPIWKDISEAEIKTHSPILAGMVAVEASRGVAEVVAEVKLAVGIDKQQKNLSKLGGVLDKLKKLDSTLQARRAATHLLASSNGVGLINRAFTDLCSLLKAQFEEVSKTSSIMKFEIKYPMAHIFDLGGVARLRLNLRLENQTINTAETSKLHCVVYQVGELEFGGERSAPQTLWESTFCPDFDPSSAVVWTSPNSRDSFITNESLVATLTEKLISYIEREMKRRS